MAWLTKPYIVRESSIVPIVPIPDAQDAINRGARPRPGARAYKSGIMRFEDPFALYVYPRPPPLI